MRRQSTLTGFNLMALFTFVLVLVITGNVNASEGRKDEAIKAKVIETYGKLPLYFTENKGQIDSKVKYYEKSAGHATYFTKEGVYLALKRKSKKNKVRGKAEAAERSKKTKEGIQPEVIKLSFIGGNPSPEIIAGGLQGGKVNYFLGNHSKKWKTNIPTYREVFYKEIYKGIDIRFYGNNRQLEYDIVVRPGTEPSTVKLSYEGIDGLTVTDKGDLEIRIKNGSILQKKPYIYQEIGGKRVEVEGRFKVQRDSEDRFSYTFEAASYNKTHPLIMDPVLIYSTYLGGGNYDYGEGIAVDQWGNAYVTGGTDSTDFPTQDPIQGDAGYGDIFVTKINSSGNALVYSTYLGGSSSDHGEGIAVDSSGNAYVTGETDSTDFPTQDPIQGLCGGGTDVFVTEINPAGNALVYSTYLGGSSSDYGHGIAVDSSGNAYVTGGTWSPDFPTKNAYDAYCGDVTCPCCYSDAFVTKINPAGDSLVYSTYLGGYGDEEDNGIAVDQSGNAYVTGYTYSDDFPTQNPVQGSNAGWDDAFVTKINPAGDTLVYSTYFGGSDYDFGNGIAVDQSGNAYVTGGTDSSNFPTQNPIQGSNAGYGDAFVTRINSDGSLSYSTYLGGDYGDSGEGIAVDQWGNAYVTGETISSNFPTQNPIQGLGAGGTDVFVTEINSAGDALVYSTCLGGTDIDAGYSIAVDQWGNAYVTGDTYSDDFPTQNPIQGPNTQPGPTDVFVVKVGNSKNDELAVDFGGNGLWHYDGANWSQLTTWDADGMKTWAYGLAVNFPSSGLWDYDGSSWDLLTTDNPEEMVGWSQGLTADFGGFGLWTYNGSSWSPLTTWDPEDMESWSGALAVDFGLSGGLWTYNGSTWTFLTTHDAEAMKAWNGGLAVDFGGFGLWNYDGTSWTLLTTYDAAMMQSWNGGLAVDFPIGLWSYSGLSWTFLTTSHPEGMESWNNGLAADFGGSGLWNYNGSSWGLLTTQNAQTMTAWTSGLAVDLGGAGLWTYDGSSWSQLTTMDADDIIAIDLNP